VSPWISVSVVNTTANWTATEPVSWALLSRNNARRIVGSVAGYEELEVTSLHIEILAGEVGGIFHLRALKNSGDGAATAVWIVLSDFQLVGIAFGTVCCLVLGLLVAIVRLRPLPETEAERERRLLSQQSRADVAAYGTFGVAEGTQLQHPRAPPLAARPWEAK
jgi:hypothetical protein